MPTRRKVCIILGSTYPSVRGGNEILFTDISKIIMKKRGWEFVVLGRQPRTPGVLAFENPLPTMVIDTLRTRKFGRLFEYKYLSFLDQLFFGLKVGGLCDKYLSDFDAVITPDPVIILKLAKKKLRPPLIQFVSGAWADTIIAIQPLLGPFVRRIERKAYQLADHIVAMDRIYAKQIIREKESFEIIPSGVNSTIFDPARYERDKLRAEFSMVGKRAIVTVATLRRGIKGHEVLLRAIPQVIEVCPECHFFFAGKGAQEWLRNLARSLGITEHLHLLGERHDIPQLLAASDLFVLPSFSEGTPRALLEAMAMKLPCIATRVGGIPEIITHQKNGILIKAGVPEAISSAIVHIFSSAEGARTLGEQARNRIVENYSIEATANAYVALIERLCR